jgi:outer membrane protein OmpA-like peptidoglycan-associated protein
MWMNTRLPVLTAICSGFAWFLASGGAYASSLDDITSTWPEANLRVALSQPDSRQVEQGTNFGLRIGADQDASVLLILVNSQDKAEVLRPHREDTADRISRGTELLFPDTSVGETLYANMPVGKAYVYVLASPDTLVPDSDPAVSAGNWVSEAQIGRKLVDALRAKDGKIAVRRIAIDVTSPAVDQFISSQDFVAFYDPQGPRTRGVCHPARGLAVQFAHDSAELTDWGKKQLSEVASGMQDQKLRGLAFVIEGHTDDQGSDEYNLGLSDRRAKRVQVYLADRGVDEDRLKKLAMGKAGPAVEGQSAEARAQNRRVVIKRLDNSAECAENKH